MRKLIGETTFIVHDEGVNLINRLRKFELMRISICDNAIKFCVPLKNKLSVERILGRKSYVSKTSNNIFSVLNFFYTRSILVVMAIICTIGFFVCEQFAFKTSLNGLEGEEKLQVSKYLQENGFGAVTHKSYAQNTDFLIGLVNEFPFVAHASMSIRGSTIIVDVLRAENYSGENLGDILATIDGVVAEILVFSGTQLVTVGDVVRKGEVLVNGERPYAIIKIVNGEECVTIVHGQNPITTT